MPTIKARVIKAMQENNVLDYDKLARENNTSRLYVTMIIAQEKRTQKWIERFEKESLDASKFWNPEDELSDYEVPTLIKNKLI